MYGTVARFRLKPGGEAQFKAIMDEFDQNPPQGFIREYLYRLDADSNAYLMVAVFQDRQTYTANASSQWMDALYRRFRALMEGDPEWNDGEIIAVSGA